MSEDDAAPSRPIRIELGDARKLLELLALISSSTGVTLEPTLLESIHRVSARVLRWIAREKQFDPDTNFDIQELKINTAPGSSRFVLARTRDNPQDFYVVKGTMLLGTITLDHPRIFGYRFDNENVVFEYEFDEATSIVTDGNVGLTFRVQESGFRSVAVAGDFNQWQPAAMSRHEGGRRWEFSLSRAELRLEKYAFKFVLDGNLWVEPPTFASNVTPTGLDDEALNLVLILDPLEAR